MSEHNETLAEIAAEMRRGFDQSWHDINREWAYGLADRIEAAHKREVDKLNSVIQATVSRSDAEIDRLRRERDTLQRERDELAKDYNNAQRERSTANSKLREMEKSVGNAVKLREALVKIREIVTADAPADEVEIANIAYLALAAAPPRNCDVYKTPEESIRMFESYIRESGKVGFINPFTEVVKWLLALATEQKGETDAK